MWWRVSIANFVTLFVLPLILLELHEFNRENDIVNA
jgi:hypothetical protein